MKNRASILVITAFVAGIFSTACSQREKAENAAEEVQEAKQDLSEVETEYNREWDAFHTSAEERIQFNESEIARYKELKKTNKHFKDRYAARIDELETKNQQLKDQIDAYEREENRAQRKERWEEFKREFNHDMDELGQAFKDITVDNSK